MTDESKNALLKSTVSMLRAVLVSAQGGIPLYRVEKEYEEVTMQPLPFKELGYHSCLELLKSLTDVVVIEPGQSGEVTIKAVASKADAHVAKLVAGQKKKKLSKSAAASKRRQASSYGKHSTPRKNMNIPRKLPGGIHQFAEALKTLPYYDNGGRRNFPSNVRNKGGKNLPSKGLVNSSKYVGTPWHPPPRMSKVKQRQTAPSKFTEDIVVTKRVALDNEDTREVAFREALTEEEKKKVKENISRMLRKIPNGIWDFVLKSKYRSICNEEPPPNMFGFILEEMSDLVDVNRAIPGKAILSLKKPKSRHSSLADENDSSVATLRKEEPKVDLSSEAKKLNTTSKDFGNSKEISKLEEVTATFWDGRNVFICHVDNISKFYIQDSDPHSELCSLTDELQEFYMGPGGSSLIIKTPTMGMFCCAQFTGDYYWYRAKILSIQYEDSQQSKPGTGRQGMPQQDPKDSKVASCRVLYVDYGNQELLGMEQIRQLDKRFLSLPAQGILCHLGSIWPSEGDNWTPEEISVFQNLVAGKNLKCKLLKQEGLSLSIDLITDTGVSISNEIVKSGNAVYSPDLKKEPYKLERSRKNSPTLIRHDSLDTTSQEELKGRHLEFPSDPFIDVYVSHVNSTSDFFVILDGHDYYERLETLENSMLEYFSDPSQVHPPSVIEGEIYAACSMSEWYRCKVTAVHDNSNQVDIVFLDHGDESTVSLQDIRRLPSSFLKLPFQAIPCALYNLPGNVDDKVNDKFKEIASEKIFVASVVARNSKLYVELLDTSSDTDQSINEELLKLNPDAQILTPSLCRAEDNMRIEAYLVYISDDGTLHLQIPGPGYDQLEEIIAQVTERFSKPSTAADFHKPEPGTMCFAKGGNDQNWYRAIIKRVLQGERKVELEFVDFGDTDVVSMTSIRSLGAASSTAVTLPHQVVKCKLAGFPNDSKISWKDGLADQLIDEINDRAVWIQTQKNATKKSLALVHLYRTRDDGSVVERSVTEELLEAMEMTSSSDDTSFRQHSSTKFLSDDEKGYSISRSETPSPEIFVSSGNVQQITSRDGIVDCRPKAIATDEKVFSPDEYLEQAQLPSDSHTANESNILLSHASAVKEKFADHLVSVVPELRLPGKWMEVKACLTFDPHRFSVQLLSSMEALCNMHIAMEAFYRDSERDSHPLLLDHLFAVYRPVDHLWYRAIVRSKGLDLQVCVEYVDYGDKELVPISSVRRLDPQFCNLPFQAIPASLVGVKPTARKWTRASERRFKELVENKVLVARIYTEKSSMRHLRRDVVKMKLYDTSHPTKDIIIGDKLVAEGVAVVDTALS